MPLITLDNILSKPTPLIVDLDHTLIDTDLLAQSLLSVFKKNPLLSLVFPFWLMRGKGYLKDQLVRRFSIDPATLPYNQKVIDYITQRKKQGDPIILATASHKRYAFAVAQYLRVGKIQKHQTKALHLFDDVMATNKQFNLSSHNKANQLIQRFGKYGFDYMGDHMRDLPVWEAAHLSVLVNVSKRVIKRTKHLNTLLLVTKN